MWIGKTVAFMTSQTLSLIGTSIVQYALMWYVTLETKSGVWMTVYIICGFLPTLILSPFAGVWADRFDRKKLIMISDGIIALITLFLAIAFAVGGKSLALIMAAAALRAVGSAIQGPAVGAILPQFVPEDQLTRVNGISGALQAGLMIVSPMLAGLLVSVWPMFVVFFIDTVTAVIAISVLLFFLHVKPHEKAAAKQETTYFTDLKLGIKYIRDHGFLLSFFFYLAIILFLITPAAMLTPLQVARSFGSEVWRLTAIEIVFSAGMLAGSGLISVWGGFKNRIYTLLLSITVMALCTIGLGIAGIFWLYLGFMGVFGIAIPFFNTPSAVFLQERVEQNYLGRVFSINTMLFSSVWPLGMLIVGPIVEIIPIEPVLVCSGLLMLALIFVMRMDGKLVRASLSKTEAAQEQSGA